MYSLRVLFFVLPLYFSHVFSPFGIAIWESYSFERYKVYLFLILLIIAYIEWLILYPGRIWEIFRQYIFQIIGLLLIPVVSAMYFVIPFDSNWLFGSYEKHHGYLFYTSIVLLVPLLLVSTREHLRSYLNSIISAAIIVAVLAIGEYLGGIWDIYGRSGVDFAYSGRSLSTLGNPNYLSGYLLLVLPLLARWCSPERWILLFLFGCAMVTTGSYIGIFLMWVYLCYLVLRSLNFPKFVSSALILMSTIICLIIGSYLLDSDKILSLMSRLVLMSESLSMMFHNPVSFLIGFGPDSLLSHFATLRSQMVNSYFPSNMLIDSSHNIIIDILFQYGIVPIMLMGYFLYRYFGNQKEELQIAILFGIVFLSLNVFVVVHMVVLALLMTLILETKKS